MNGDCKMSPQKPLTAIFVFSFFCTVTVGTYIVARYVACIGSVRNFVFCETPLKRQSVGPPVLVFFWMYVGCKILNVHVVVPVKHVVSVVVPLFEMVPDSLIVLLLNVEWMGVVVA